MSRVTEVYLLYASLSPKQNETFLFNSVSEQRTFFHGRTKHAYNNLSIQRQNNIIKIPEFFENITDCNYVMFRNNGESKWYYAFITKYNYINDNCTEINYKIDCLQTYQFNYTIKASFVEREHVNDDTIGKNTVNEGIELGELKRFERNFNTGLTDLVYIMGSKYTIEEDGSVTEYGGTIRNGMLSCIGLRKYEKSEAFTLLEDIQKIENKKENSILFISAIPRFCLSTVVGSGRNINNTNGIPSKEIKPQIYLNSIDGYVPKNNKLFTYPFSSLVVSNNNGQQILLKIEDFEVNEPRFYIKTFLGSQPVFKIIPYNYKGTGLNYDNSIDFVTFPQIEYTTEAYKSFLNSSMQGIFSNLIATGVNIYSGNTIGALLSASNTATSISNYNLKSDNINGSGVTGQLSLLDNKDFSFYQQSVQNEHAKIIDEYFSRFGYEVDRVKVPNLRGRQAFNYVKTKNVLIVGEIPYSYLEEIQDIFDRGITFWHDFENFGNYNIDNPII